LKTCRNHGHKVSKTQPAVVKSFAQVLNVENHPPLHTGCCRFSFWVWPASLGVINSFVSAITII